MGRLDAALGKEAAQNNFHYMWGYRGSKNKHHGEAYISGLIGEREGRKWLGEQGYEVYEFGMMEAYFREIKDTSERLSKRRKQAYMEQDKAHIKKFEDRLRGIFDGKFEEARGFFCEFLPKRREIWRTRRRSGGISPDFMVKKNGVFSIVEVKANTSKPSVHQRMCFGMAKSHGFDSMVLRVTVESRLAKEMKLSEC